VRKPVVHFVALGALFFAVKNFAFGAAAPVSPGVDLEPAVVSLERIDELRQDWLSRTGALPGSRELDALIEAEIDDTVMLLEARRRGWHRSDSVVQLRLLRNMEFLKRGEDGERTPEELLREAYALRMDETDLVVRRRLIQKLNLEVFAGARAPEPTEAELQQYLEDHAERFTQPERFRISHVFLSRDLRGSSLERDANALLSAMQSDGSDAKGSSFLGDPFLFPLDLPPRSQRELARTFGPEFAERVPTLPTGRWSGPVESAYGLHLVWLHDRQPAVLSPLASVRSAVRESLLNESGERALRAYLKELRARVPVLVEVADETRSGS
jgi:hypothetical protein